MTLPQTGVASEPTRLDIRHCAVWLFAIAQGAAFVMGQEPVVAYRGATIETMGPAGRIEGATLIVRGEKIEAVGADAPIPETARIIDARGKTLLPGLIDPYRVVNIATDGSEPEQTRTIVIRGRTFTISGRGSITSTSFARVADSFYPYDDKVLHYLRSGITHLNLVARGHGQAAIARVTPEQPAAMIENPDGILFAALTNQTASLDVVRNNLALVARRPASASGPGATTTGSAAPASASRESSGSGGAGASSIPQVGAGRELWQKIHDGESQLLINASNAATILHLLKLLEPYPKVRIVLVATGGSVFQTLDQMKGRNITLVLRPTIDLVPDTRERVCVPCLAYKAGMEFAFSLAVAESDLITSQDAPLFPVAYLVRSGLPRKVALEALTTSPAKLLGLDQTHGSLEPGKSANIVVFDGDPLDPASQVREVVIAGRTVYEG